MRKVAVLVVLLAACGAPAPRAQPRADGAVRVLLGGDVMLGRNVAPIARLDPSGLFADVRSAVSGSDLVLANLESPLTLLPHVSSNPNAIEAEPSAASLLADAGFDAMSVANNHAGDAGREGLVDTLGALEAAGLSAAAGGRTLREAFAPDVFVRNGLRVAVLALDATGRGRPGRRRTPRGSGVPAAFDPYLARIGRTLAGWGVDVVWGQGAHVAQPVRLIDPDGDGRPTVFATSLGNFLFDQAIPGTQRGALLEVEATPTAWSPTGWAGRAAPTFVLISSDGGGRAATPSCWPGSGGRSRGR